MKNNLVVESFFFDIQKGIFYKSKLYIGERDFYFYVKVLKKKGK